MIDCFSKIKKYVKESGLNIPDERLREFAFILERAKSESLTSAEFTGKIRELIGQHIERIATTKRLVKAQYLAKREADLELVLDQSYGKTVAQNLLDFTDGGATKPSNSSNRDPSKYRGAIEGDLFKTFRRTMEPYKEVMASGKLDREIFQELHAIDQVETLGKSGSNDAVEIAKGIHGLNNEIFDLKKGFNPYMERTSEYLMKRIWDRETVSGFDKSEYVADMIQHYSRSFPELAMPEKEIVFGSIYDRIKDGSYGSVSDDEDADKFITVMGPGANIMKTMSRARHLIANDSDSAYEMNLKYGYGTIAKTMDQVIRGAARDLSQMEKFTANPRAYIETLYTRALDRAPQDQKDGLRNAKKKIMRNFQTLMGDFDTPAKSNAAKIARGFQTVEYLAKTGTSLIKSQLDLANTAMIMRGYNGKSLLENAHEIASEYYKGLAVAATKLGNTDHLNSELEKVWMFSHAYRGAMVDYLGGNPDGSGKMAKLARLQGRASMMNAHVDVLRSAFGSWLARDLADVSHLSYAELTPIRQQTLLRFGLGEHEWNTVRLGTQQFEDPSGVIPEGRRKLLDADGMDHISDEVIGDYLTRSGQVRGDPSDEAIFRARKRLSFMVGAMINDGADRAVAHSGTRTRASLLQGTDPDSPMGIFTRLVGQFKGPAFTQFDIGARGFHSSAGPDGSPKGDYAGTAHWAIGLMFFSAIGMAIRALKDGKTPEDPRSFEYMRKVVAQSGAGGIVGDNVINMMEKDKLSDQALELVNSASPVIGDALKIAHVAGGYLKGKAPNAEAVKVAQGLIPGQNLFWGQAAFNYYIGNGIKEWLSPGYEQKLHDAASKRGQKYLMMDPKESWNWPKAIKRAVR